MKKICFITGTRADYGIMAPIMKEIEKSPDAQLQIIATNMHLSPDFGMTVNEIEADGFKVDVKIESLIPGGTPSATVKSMARVEEGLAEAFTKLNPDLVVILGDRYETLAAASAAVVFNIPIAHLHGGETTEGAIDDAFRHAITKLSTYHFASTPQYADKIISMGEDSSKVFHSGAPGAECRSGEIDVPQNEIALEFDQKTGINPYEPFIILAYHPVTLLPDKGVRDLKATLEALDSFVNQGYKVLVTMPNSDPGTSEITKILKDWIANNPHSLSLTPSLGSRLFHFALDHASAIVGNSSAALIEAPTHRLPAVNVGIRQKGRAHGLTVIDVPGETTRIEKALSAALSMEMKAVLLGLTVSSL
ncbi:MAG: UDP-N-acetylglucosamine 2-epimerase (hydrolyzing), partial [Muribaculaceae bacterium]|nr:UDP-N-acetylglucosamine 2-epimerase (hydrolyzing) [Muribaculaceae bacterium]